MGQHEADWLSSHVVGRLAAAWMSAYPCVLRPYGIVTFTKGNATREISGHEGRMDSLFKDSPSARHILWALSLLLVMWGVLTACDSRPMSQRHPPSTSVPTAGSTPAVVATLPRLTSEIGWHDVLTMSDTTGSGIQSMRQSFTASKPYVIFFSCKG